MSGSQRQERNESEGIISRTDLENQTRTPKKKEKESESSSSKRLVLGSDEDNGISTMQENKDLLQGFKLRDQR